MTQVSARRFLIVATALLALGLLAGLVTAMFSFFLFDAPGSEKNPGTIVLFFSALTLPFSCAGAIAAAWVFYAFGKFKAALWMSILPACNVLAGAGAMIWLQIFNGGRLN